MPTCRKRLSVREGGKINRARKLKPGAPSLQISTGTSSVRQKVNRDLPAGSLTPRPGTGPLPGFGLETLRLEEPFADVQVQLHVFQPAFPVRLERKDAAPGFSCEAHAGRLARPGPQGADNRAVAVRGHKAADADARHFRQLARNQPVEPCRCMPHHLPFERLARVRAPSHSVATSRAMFRNPCGMTSFGMTILVAHPKQPWPEESGQVTTRHADPASHGPSVC